MVLNLRMLLASLVLFSACLSTALGQTTFGSLSGTVTDPGGGLVPRARVTLTNLGTNTTQTTVTNSNGIYDFVNVLPGDYRLEVEGPASSD